MKKLFYSTTVLFVMMLCASGMAGAGAYTPDEMLIILGFTPSIDCAGASTDSGPVWEPMQSKMFIQRKRMFLLDQVGKKRLASTGTYKLNNGELIAVRNGVVQPKQSCR